MSKKYVKVLPSVIDLKFPGLDRQEALFSPDEDTLLKLDSNESPIRLSESVIDSLKTAIETKSLNRHPDYSARKLRRMLSRYTGVSFDSITCFNSEATAIESIARTYLEHGLDSLVTWPNEGMASYNIAATGARVINTQFENPFEPRIEELISGISHKTRMIYISNPNPITGAIFSEAELVFLLSYAQNIMIVVDESYFEYCGNTIAGMIGDYPNLIVTRNFSRAFGLAGLDLCYIISDPENLRHISKFAAGKHPNTITQTTAIAALNDPKYLAKSLYQLNESKKMLHDVLLTLGYDFVISPANFITLKVNDPVSFTEKLVQKNIYINQLANLPGFDNYVRVTIGTPAQSGILLDILGELTESQAIRPNSRHNRLKKPETIAM